MALLEHQTTSTSCGPNVSMTSWRVIADALVGSSKPPPDRPPKTAVPRAAPNPSSMAPDRPSQSGTSCQ
jgi:hypothetical protein